MPWLVRSGYFRVASATYAPTSAICCGVSSPWYVGMALNPSATRSTTSVAEGRTSSRFGADVPVDCDADSVWHAPQPATVQTLLPCGALPSRSRAASCAFSAPTATLFLSSPPHAATPSTTASTTAIDNTSLGIRLVAV